MSRYYNFEIGGQKHRLEFETGKVWFRYDRGNVNRRSCWQVWFSFNSLDAEFVTGIVDIHEELKHVERAYKLNGY